MGKWRERLERRLNGPAPIVDPIEIARKHNRQLLKERENKAWTVKPDKVTSCVPYERSFIDREAAYHGRSMEPDYGDGVETIDDVVRRQDRTR